MDNDRALLVSTFFDTEDDTLLLDDANTDNRCWKCQGTGFLQGDPVGWLNTTNNMRVPLHAHALDDHQLEDSPLLNDDRIGHLTVKDFHCHSVIPPDNNTHALRTLCLVALICFIFMMLEVIGGHIAGSLAVMTDAAHLFSDIIGFLMSIISIWISKKPKTRRMTFGFYRVEVMGAFISILVIWVLSGIFCYVAIGRIVRKDLNINVNVMLVVALLGIIINIIMGALLHGCCFKTPGDQHSHGGLFPAIQSGHTHSHSHGDNINIRAAAAHVVGDLLQSLGVVVAAIVIKIFPEAAIADPICTILFSVIIMVVTYKVARDSMLVLIEASTVDTASIAGDLTLIGGVKHVHSLHAWCLAPGKDAFAVHLAVDENCDKDAVLSKATSVVRRNMNAVTCTIQIEPYDHEQMTACLDCQQ